jgi:transcriptional regulator with XRE-family HTH domain
VSTTGIVGSVEVVVAGMACEHYSNQIDTSIDSFERDVRWVFDSVALARTMVAGRHRLGLSSRDLAQHAGISQAYVVRLERAGRPGAHQRPTPTVDVLARLAQALRLTPADLLQRVLRYTGRHVLLVTEDRRRSPLDHARARVGGSVDSWLSATSQPTPLPTTHRTGPNGQRSINLRRGAPQAYDPQEIAGSLADELRVLADDLHGREIGLVFPEVSRVMQTLAEPRRVIDFEHRWADVVSSAASSVGAHAAWNVCVYEIGALRSLPDPVEAALDLMRSHDTIWSARGHDVAAGPTAAGRILRHLRPTGVSQASWRATTGRLVTQLGLSA